MKISLRQSFCPRQDGSGRRIAAKWVYQVCQLLLDENLRHLGLRAIGISHGVRDRTRLTVSRVADATSFDNLAALLRGYRQGVIVDRFVRSRVGVGITGHGVVFAIELARPFVVPGFAIGVDAVLGDFHAAPRSRRDSQS